MERDVGAKERGREKRLMLGGPRPERDFQGVDERLTHLEGEEQVDFLKFFLEM